MKVAFLALLANDFSGLHSKKLKFGIYDILKLERDCTPIDCFTGKQTRSGIGYKWQAKLDLKTLMKCDLLMSSN